MRTCQVNHTTSLKINAQSKAPKPHAGVAKGGGRLLPLHPWASQGPLSPSLLICEVGITTAPTWEKGCKE